ncbi:MAG: hypothetical protein PHC61_05840 [Chitinivibrionales bacterium]|nr:hypothetical protein [Chitinivibrionales bacterium]
MKKHWLVPAFVAFCFFTAAYGQYNCYPQSNWTFGPQVKKAAIMWVVGHAGDDPWMGAGLLAWYAQVRKFPVIIVLTTDCPKCCRVNDESCYITEHKLTNPPIFAHYTETSGCNVPYTLDGAWNCWGGKDKVIEYFTWLFRKYKPDVIVTHTPQSLAAPSPPSDGNHPDHLASAQACIEAYTAAADPARYPGQLDSLSVWQVKKLYVLLDPPDLSVLPAHSWRHNWMMPGVGGQTCFDIGNNAGHKCDITDGAYYYGTPDDPFQLYATSVGYDVQNKDFLEHVDTTVYATASAPFGGYWSFNETSGTAAADGSANKNNATLMGGASFTTGKSGNGVSLNGTTGWVDIPDQTTAGDFTVAAWVNLTGTIGNNQAIVGQEGAGADINFAGGKLRLYTGSGDAVIATTAISAGTWTHCAITRLGSTLTLYLNGVRDATGSLTGSFSVQAIGRGNVGTTTQGKLDEVYLYNRALSASEIAVLAAPPTTGVLPLVVDIKSFSFNTTGNTINYVLPKACFVSIRYYDLQGRTVCSFVNNYQQAGNYSLTIPASLSKNIYVRELRAGDFVKKDMLTVVR